MASHNVPGQMLGYLYQALYALNLLMASDDEEYQISMERFDDVAFDLDGDPRQLIQVKHHVGPASLTDTSVDLWRTLKVWIDAIEANKSLLEHTDFCIVTTAVAPPDSAAAYIINGDTDAAYKALCVAANRQSKTNAKYYASFLGAKDDARRLIERMRVISSASNAVKVEREIRKHVLYAFSPAHDDYLSTAVERIEGWWFRECVKALISNELTIMTQRQLRSKVYEIASQYHDECLPIEFRLLDDIDESELDPSDRIFLEQLRLLRGKSNRLRIAIRDYYRASKQRSSWLRQGLLYPNELDGYESRLIEEWERAFSDMEENLEEFDSPTEADKITAGKQLFAMVMDRDIRIRSRVDEPYVMRGTYHTLANHLEVGWHVDFAERLKHLVDSAGQ